jgi:hypothetical protein
VKRVRVAIDACIPERLVRMLNSGFGDTGYEFVWEPEFAPANADDEFWAVAFKRFGGAIVIFGDKNIAKRPHQIAAFRDSGLISFFMLHGWSNMDLTFKAAHTISWWPKIQAHLAQCQPGDSFWVPMTIRNVPFKKVMVPDGIAKTKAATK